MFISVLTDSDVRLVHTFALFAGFKGLIGVLLKDVVRHPPC